MKEINNLLIVSIPASATEVELIDKEGLPRALFVYRPMANFPDIKVPYPIVLPFDNEWALIGRLSDLGAQQGAEILLAAQYEGDGLNAFVSEILEAFKPGDVVFLKRLTNG